LEEVGETGSELIVKGGIAMVETKRIKYLLASSLIWLIFFCTQLANVNAELMQLSNDNGTAEYYCPWLTRGNIFGAVLTPNLDWSYPIQVDSVEFLLYQFPDAASSATVRVHVYSTIDGEPDALLGSSAPTIITTFWPTWASISLASADVTLSSPEPLMVAVEYTAGTSGSIPSLLTDTRDNIATGKNFYSLDSGVTWYEHYDFWQVPEDNGYNMIRATVNVLPAPATDTPTFTPTPTSTSTATPTTTPTPTSTSTTIPPESPEEWKIYFPGVAKSWSPPSVPTPVPTTPTSTATRMPTPTSTATRTPTPTDTPTPIPTPTNIPCLLVLAQKIGSYGGFKILLGCVTGELSCTTTWRYDPTTGAINGFDLACENGQGAIIYQASIDIQRDQFGRIRSYGGTVSGPDFPAFTETIVNEYDQFGKVARADVTKVYTASGDTYTMDLTPCWLGDSWSGYRVKVWGGGYDGEELIVGNCN